MSLKLSDLPILFSILMQISFGQNETNGTNAPTLPPISTTRNFATTSTPAACSALHAYIYFESTNDTIQETLLSQRVNFPPYYYDETVISRELTLFGDNDNITDNLNNICNVSTWSVIPSIYDNKIVMITFSDYYFSLCSPQEWILNLENYANIKGVIIANDKDLNDVYALAGDNTLTSPTIPARMISQNSASEILYVLNNLTETIWAKFDCFNTTSPPIICVLDHSVVGNNFELDGEFQLQANTFHNNHPVWLKTGITNGEMPNYYIWLDVNHSLSTDSWRWVISTAVGSASGIVAECLLTTNDSSSDYVDDPTLCGFNWHINGKYEANLTSNAGVCDLADTYMCITATTPQFSTYFNGRYRMIHDGIPVWVSDLTPYPAYVVIEQLPTWIFSPAVYGFIVYDGHPFYAGDFWAMCPIQAVSVGYPSNTALQPWACNDIWAVYDCFIQFGTCSWWNDLGFDVDECQHPNAPNTTVTAPIIYPSVLCLKNNANSAYSHHQGMFGVYLLDNTTFYDGKPTYFSKRLFDMNRSDQWYIVWFDEKERWVINWEIPQMPIVIGYNAQCNQDINTPDQCSVCWEFTGETHTYITYEINCNASMFVLPSDFTDSDCLVEPVNTIITPTTEITLCFDDGTTLSNTYSNVYTGKYILGSTSYHNRSYWINDGGYYLFYDERFKFWVIDTSLNFNQEQWDLYCLIWDEFEPFNQCNIWYTDKPSNLTMSTDCTLFPTMHPTDAPTDPTVPPTYPPSLEPITMNPTTSPVIQNDLEKSGGDNSTEIILGVIVGILVCCLLLFAFLYYRNKQKNNGVGMAQQSKVVVDKEHLEFATIGGIVAVKSHDEEDDGVDGGETVTYTTPIIKYEE